jgi:hypothetical protein
VEVLRGVHDALTAIGGPELGHRHLLSGGQSRPSAARWPTAWNEAIGRSNCSRVFVYSAVRRTASSHTPTVTAQ